MSELVDPTVNIEFYEISSRARHELILAPALHVPNCSQKVAANSWAGTFGSACHPYRKSHLPLADALRSYGCLLLPRGFSKSFVKNKKTGRGGGDRTERPNIINQITASSGNLKNPALNIDKPLPALKFLLPTFSPTPNR
jgi:hypothetical protein